MWIDEHAHNSHQLSIFANNHAHNLLLNIDLSTKVCFHYFTLQLFTCLFMHLEACHVGPAGASQNFTTFWKLFFGKVCLRYKLIIYCFGCFVATAHFVCCWSETIYKISFLFEKKYLLQNSRNRGFSKY